MMNTLVAYMAAAGERRLRAGIEAMAKARDLIEPCLSSTQTSLPIKTIFEIEKVKNIGSLRLLLQPPSVFQGA